MSYFWKKSGNVYHWHLHCTAVPVYIRTNPEWEVNEQRPKDKNPCKECREKDIAKKIKEKA